jgi:hypothetical protein
MKTEMDWKKDIGLFAYRIKDNKIQKERIDEGRETVHLNTGSDMHGRLLDPVIEFRFARDKDWTKAEDVYFTKDEILRSLNEL